LTRQFIIDALGGTSLLGCTARCRVSVGGVLAATVGLEEEFDMRSRSGRTDLQMRI